VAVSGDVIQVGVSGVYAGITVMRNIYYYRLEDAPTADYLNGLLTEFQTQVLTPFAATQATNFVLSAVTALNIFGGDVFEDVTPTPAAGTRTPSANPSPSFLAGMVLLTRTNNRVRHGRKFIFAPSEEDITGNGFAGGFITLANTYAASLDNALDAGGIDLFKPIILGRVKYTTPEGGEAYRLPLSQDEMADNWSYVGTPRFVNRCTTMNTRKYWKGE